MRDLGKQRIKMIERLNEMGKEWRRASERLDSIIGRILRSLYDEEKITAHIAQASTISGYIDDHLEAIHSKNIKEYWETHYRPLLQRQIDQNFVTLKEEIERLTREQATKQGP